MKRALAVVVAAVVTSCAVAYGAPRDALLKLLRAAEYEWEKGNYGAALDQIDKAKPLAFEMAPLTLKNFQLVEKPGEAYGIYQPRESNVYRAGEEIYIYAEPSGYTFRKNGDLYRFSISADFTILDAGGKVMGGQKKFATFGLTSRRPNTEFILNLTCSLTGANPGRYMIETTVRDDFSDKRTSKRVEIEIR